MARPRADADALRALLAAETHEAATDAFRTNGQVTAERLESLGRLTRLAEMADAAAARSRRRWAIPSVAIATLACASVMLFARTSSTEVAMELKVSEFSFVLPTAQALTDEMTVSRVGVSGLTAIDLPDPQPGPGATRREPDIYVAADGSGPYAGAVSVNAIVLPAGSRITLKKLDGTGRYALTLRGATSELAVSVIGPTRLVVPPTVNDVRRFPFPRRVTLMPDPRLVTLDVTIADTSRKRRTFRSPLPAESLFFFRIDRLDDALHTLVRQVSTIDSGTLYFESINGGARPLRAGEAIHFARSHGEISDWLLADDGIVLRFRGRVAGMSSGSGDIRRSLMPTVLDWLRAQHGLSLLWGTTAYGVGLFITVLGWWKRPS